MNYWKSVILSSYILLCSDATYKLELWGALKVLFLPEQLDGLFLLKSILDDDMLVMVVLRGHSINLVWVLGISVPLMVVCLVVSSKVVVNYEHIF